MKQELKNLSWEEKHKLSTSEIGKLVKQQLKQEYPNLTFSISTNSYSGGSSLNVNLMKSDVKIKQDASSLNDDRMCLYLSDRYTLQQLQEMQNKQYHQLNKYQFYDDYKEDSWYNGVFLTKEGYEICKRVVEIVQQYNWDNSDAMTDYFDVHFYLNFDLGKWDKPFIDGGN